MLVKIKCHYCGKKVKKQLGHVNRAKASGLNVFCNRRCAGLAHRSGKTEAELKAEKRLYDIEYREKNERKLKKIRAEYFKKDYAAHPEKYKERRRSCQQKHNDYCRRPEYVKKKKEYDRKRRAKLHYDKFWESSIALRELGRIVDNRQAKAEQKNISKSQKRKRNAKQINRQELEKCSVGLY